MRENAICKACRSGKLLKREVAQDFEHEGLEVRIEGIPALVCERCSQVYLSPGIGDKVSSAANHLFVLSEVKHAGGYKATV